MKQIHFYESKNYNIDTLCYTWEETEWAFKRQDLCIRTTQMGFLSFSARLFESGYRIFVHEKDEAYEIKLGGENERTNRELRMTHNIFRMWLKGEFDAKVYDFRGRN